MIPRFTILLLLLIGAAIPAAAQNREPGSLMPPINSTPTPVPLIPPTNPGPAVAPSGGLSPLLSQPAPVYTTPPAGPAYPAATNPSPLDQQQMQSYRSDLLGQRWQLQQQGVSPDNERYRELQQQLNQPSSR